MTFVLNLVMKIVTCTPTFPLLDFSTPKCGELALALACTTEDNETYEAYLGILKKCKISTEMVNDRIGYEFWQAKLGPCLELKPFAKGQKDCERYKIKKIAQIELDYHGCSNQRIGKPVESFVWDLFRQVPDLMKILGVKKVEKTVDYEALQLPNGELAVPFREIGK